MDWIELGYFGLFVATFLAATILPFSSEIVLVSLIAAGFDPIHCFIIATLGNTLGGMTSYGLATMSAFPNG